MQEMEATVHLAPAQQDQSQAVTVVRPARLLLEGEVVVEAEVMAEREVVAEV